MDCDASLAATSLSIELRQLREIMRNFYSPLKDCDPHLQFVFITGITKFSQLSIFSELNNLKNISMLPAFAAVCGISEDEVRTQMPAYVEDYAATLGITPDEGLAELKHQYDGYHFSWPSPGIFNPFSLLNSLQDKMLKPSMQRLSLSARAYSCILKVARTIADLASSEKVQSQHIAEAIGYRNLDRGD